MRLVGSAHVRHVDLRVLVLETGLEALLVVALAARVAVVEAVHGSPLKGLVAQHAPC